MAQERGRSKVNGTQSPSGTGLGGRERGKLMGWSSWVSHLWGRDVGEGLLKGRAPQLPLKVKGVIPAEMVGRYSWKSSQHVQRQEVSTEHGARTGSGCGGVRGMATPGRQVSDATLGSVGFVLK